MLFLGVLSLSPKLLLKWLMHACVCAKSLQLCLTLCDPMDCSPPGSSVHGILQSRILEWVAIPFSRGSSRPSSEMFTELYREEKKEAGDRGGQKDKGGNEKEGDRSSQ